MIMLSGDKRMIKTVYINTKRSKALRLYRRLKERGFITMWAGENTICMMKSYND